MNLDARVGPVTSQNFQQVHQFSLSCCKVDEPRDTFCGMEHSETTFGAICTRCNRDFRTRTWRAAHKHLCPSCLVGIMRASK